MPKLKQNGETGKPHPQTGPTSLAGKEKSSQNSTTHGCRSTQHRILPGESEEEYRQLHNRWQQEYRPVNDVDRAMIERLVQAEWRMIRCERQLVETEAHIGLKPIYEWTDDDEKIMQRARRYHREAQRLYTAARRDLDSLRITRQRETVAIVQAAKALQKLPVTNPADPQVSQEGAIRPADLLARLDSATQENSSETPQPDAKSENDPHKV